MELLLDLGPITKLGFLCYLLTCIDLHTRYRFELGYGLGRC